MIQMACRLKGFVPLVYAILPDHLHLLVCSQRSAQRTLESVRCAGGARDTAGMTDARIIEKASETVTDYAWYSGGLSGPLEPQPGALVKSIKGTFSRTLSHGTIWKRRYHCWLIIDARDATRVVEYIAYNYRHSGVSEQYSQEPFVWRDDKLIGQLLS